MRLLPVRSGHVGRSLAGTGAQAYGLGYRFGDVGQYLPLRDLPADPRRHQRGCRGMSTITGPPRPPLSSPSFARVEAASNPSRRHVLGAGSLMLAFAVLGRS